MKILTNHMGYSVAGPKKAVLQAEGNQIPERCVLTNETGSVRCVLDLKPIGTVAHWQTGNYWLVDFSDFAQEGTWYIEAECDGRTVRSHSFEISRKLLTMRMLNAVSYYFKAQRSTGEWLYCDRALPFEGERQGIVDAHGGWFDATGDYGIHLSHLSHSSYHNPQQVPFSAYTFFKMHEFLAHSGNEEYTMLKRRALDEGFFGADFLMRMRAPSGTFFRSINRAQALDAVQGSRCLGFEYHGSSDQFSEKAATADEETIADENYECSLRSGGGLGIAALAAAGRHFYLSSEHTQQQYLMAAKEIWAYLKENNLRYTNDGCWNLIDDYCALIAVTELWRSTQEYAYLMEARCFARAIAGRTVPTGEGMRRLEMAPGEPFYSAADEGLPVIALLQYAQVEMDVAQASAARQCAEEIMRYKLALTDSVANPFGYPLLEVRLGEEIKKQFFFSHHSKAAPWWQGDNARIASLAAAAAEMSQCTADAILAVRCRKMAQDPLDWIMGLNPFDSCMIEGYGHNNIQYFFKGRYDFLNCPGGIVNGITSAPEDEEGIAFVMQPTKEVDDNWRWAEQWIPHASWYLYAMALKQE